jgi:hypothetical protein
MSVIDVGCSGGIDALWRVFEPILSALFGEKLSYQEFMRRFAADDPNFYQPSS